MEDNGVAMRGLLGKVAVITGAAAGIGAAIAHLFGEEGAHVFVLDLNGSRAAAVSDALTLPAGTRLDRTRSLHRSVLARIVSGRSTKGGASMRQVNLLFCLAA